jgi:hypothetical protein
MIRRLRLLSDDFVGATAMVLCVGWLAAATSAVAQDSAQDSTQDSASTSDLARAFERCQAIEDDAARLYCYKNATGHEAANQPSPAALGTWHFVRTPDPAGGRSAVSITQSADITRSDPDFGGLMLRCGDDATEVLIVLVRYLTLGAHPKVVVKGAQTSTDFSGKVVPPGLLVLLPGSATALATGPWLAAPELSISVDDGGNTIQGIVPLTNLTGALAVLRSECAAP